MTLIPRKENVMDKLRNWVGPLSGLVFIATFVMRGAISPGIDSEPFDSASSVLAELHESADDIRLGAWIMLLGVAFLLLFLAYLRAEFKDNGAGWAGDAFLAGGVVLAGAFVVIGAFEQIGAEAGANGHTEVAQGVVDFLWNSSLIFSPGLLAIGLAAAIASFGYRALPKWLGALAVLVALGALAPWIGILVFLIWVLAASIVGIIEASRTPTTADTA
jgi:hypothetical protein